MTSAFDLETYDGCGEREFPPPWVWTIRRSRICTLRRRKSSKESFRLFTELREGVQKFVWYVRKFSKCLVLYFLSREKLDLLNNENGTGKRMKRSREPSFKPNLAREPFWGLISFWKLLLSKDAAARLFLKSNRRDLLKFPTLKSSWRDQEPAQMPPETEKRKMVRYHYISSTCAH